MNRKNENFLGVALILVGVSMWEILPPRGISFTATLAIHMSLVIPGVYLIEKPFIKYIASMISKKIRKIWQ